VLLFPGLSAPSLSGSILMLGAGVAWGIYSLRGKAASDALAATTGNFLRSVPLAAVLSIAVLPWAHIDRAGVVTPFCPERSLPGSAMRSGTPRCRIQCQFDSDQPAPQRFN